MTALQVAQTRYTTKHYDPNKRISDDDIAKLLEVLRLSPSSVNSQPWEFFVAGTDEAKAKLIPATMEANRDRIRQSSHVVVCAVREDIDDAFLNELLEKEEQDGRYPNDQTKAQQDTGRRFFVNMHRVSPSELMAWESRQAYIAMGFLLYGAASMGIDSTPLEGMEFAKLDEVLGLRQKGLRSVYAVCLGYRVAGDSNAMRPKSRLAFDRVIHMI